MGLTRRTWITCGLLYLVSQIFFLILIQFPKNMNFDEFHYVPAAKRILSGREFQNAEHPPLGKIIMAAGVGLWGDRPIGWRFMSTVFGALTLVGMYLWALALFRDEGLALWVAILTAVNSLLYVQSRIGMLDTFMFAFLAWSLMFFSAAWDSRLDRAQVRKLFTLSGAFMGLAMACKWFAIVPWLSCLILVMGVRLLQNWKVAFADPSDDDWYHPELWKGLKAYEWLLTLGVLPVFVYLLTFIPVFMSQSGPFYFSQFFAAQKQMYELQLRVVNTHPYMSEWWKWPLLNRPIWYAFETEGDHKQWVRGVLLLGNPLIMWSGLLAMIACVWSWLQERRRDAFLIVAFFVVFFGSWALIPRKIAFYYYYYPAGMLLSFAVAYVFRGHWSRWLYLAIAVGLFIYFYPILSGMKIPTETFRRWIWFSNPKWNWI